MTSIADTWLRRSHELDEPVAFPRKKKRISGRSLAILAFLTICALFFCVPLYVIVVTSLKSMDQIRQGDLFALPWHLDFSAWVTAWSKSCSGTRC